jgi:hypothetical protein
MVASLNQFDDVFLALPDPEVYYSEVISIKERFPKLVRKNSSFDTVGGMIAIVMLGAAACRGQGGPFVCGAPDGG